MEKVGWDAAEAYRFESAAKKVDGATKPCHDEAVPRTGERGTSLPPKDMGDSFSEMRLGRDQRLHAEMRKQYVG